MTERPTKITAGENPGDLPLGREVKWPERLDRSLLYRIPRPERRPGMNGHDRWVCYELTWLDEEGRVRAAIATITVPAVSPYLVESKSLKLFLGSLANERLGSSADVGQLLSKELSELLESPIDVQLRDPEDASKHGTAAIEGVSLDGEDVAFDSSITPGPEILKAGPESSIRTECLFTNLFRSRCPVTGQPDYATIVIRYEGAGIDRPALLRYLLGYRNKQDFHESCCEAIFTAIRERLAPKKLSVECLFTRRGGIEINPLRYNGEFKTKTLRTVRQ